MGCIKVNTDAYAHILVGHEVGLGVVIRLDLGHIVASAVCTMKARWEVEQTETSTN